MTTHRAPVAAGLLALLLLASGCVNEAPQLVRDEGNLYTSDVEAAAEARLQALARRTGIWFFVLTATQPDPPRMLDEPMMIADAREAHAIALLLGPNGMVGYGASDAAVAAGEYESMATLDTTPVAGRDAAETLDALLAQVEAWATRSRTPGPEPAEPPGGEPFQPSGTP